ncbi:sodium/hydrogen exchanger 9B1-like isoform X2 [Microplitis mediator]|uniref:sodium/hydrogen exchanger 9B1-like isoform X2 n=1 Tax=Microplitis mediator TaxID=375433 RepID=UPI00255432D0|nr:sodium/hydrogen exchanger 9B1-like isoform X2 [Microplitis mediator]
MERRVTVEIDETIDIREIGTEDFSTLQRPINDDDYGDESCCGRAIWCHPAVRNTRVYNPLSMCVKIITWSGLMWLLTCLTLLMVTFSTMYFLMDKLMLPGGTLFGLFWLVVVAYALGWSLTYIPYLHIPPVFGMLLAGIIFRSTGFYQIHDHISFDTTTKIRTFCVTFVMIRAGLQLTTTALRSQPIFLLKLGLLPSTVEILTISLCSRFILRYPWDWSFLAGTIMTGMSPVVTVNCILALAEKGYGEDKDLAGIIATAATIDSIHVISMFSICFTVVFSEDGKKNIWKHIPSGLRDLVAGLVVGIALGFIFGFLPHRTAKYVTFYRITGLIIGSLMFTSGASMFAVTGGGYLATMVMSFVSSSCWKQLSGNPFNVIPFQKTLFFIWHFMQPVLMGIIGAEMDLTLWSTQRFGLHISCILMGLLARSCFAILANQGTNFNMRERIFVALAWLPKGSLQATLAPLTLEHAGQREHPEIISLATDVLRMSVVSILFLAPLGAIIMMVTGPVLLNKIDEETKTRRRQLSFLQWSSLQPVRHKSVIGDADDQDVDQEVDQEDDQQEEYDNIDAADDDDDDDVYSDDEINNEDDESFDRDVRK